MSNYPRLFGLTVAFLAATIIGSARAVTIATVPVGYAGNFPDLTGFGAVPYNYRIGTYDVTNSQYAEFLNAKASVGDPYGLWNSNMDPNGPQGAISRSASAPYSYSVKLGYENKPVNYVTLYNAIRFVNWLTNGQGNGDTESGTYSITNGGTVSQSIEVPFYTQRAAWAATNSFHWLLPSDNEWYKAAYYNGADATYYAYPFQSNSQPLTLAPPGNSNSGNFQYVGYDGKASYLTDVGAYSSSLSPFGSFDMGGDVWQWNDTNDIGGNVRGGGFINLSSFSAASTNNAFAPDLENLAVGFRVASVGSVPEPNTGLLAVFACGVLWFARRRVQSNDAAFSR